MRMVGKACVLSVSGSSSGPITVGADVGEVCTKAAFLNTGATVISVQIGQVGNCPAAVIPTGSTPSTANITLPASMTSPVVFDVLQTPFAVTAIGSAGGPSNVFITPCEG